jgi:hypothetical protein
MNYLSKACRMNCDTFENIFLPSFKSFCFKQAISIAHRIMQSQSHESITMETIKSYQKERINNKKLDLTTFLKENKKEIQIQFMIEELIKSSANQNKNSYTCVDASVDVFIYKNKIYAVPISLFLEKYTIPQEAEDFSYSEDVISKNWAIRHDVWQNLNQSDRMRMEIINASKKIGLKEIENRLKETCSQEKIQNPAA